MKVLTFISALVLMITASSSYGFIPSQQKSADAMITKDHLYLKDNEQQIWKTKTDCSYSITKDSDVSIAIFGNNTRFGPRTLIKKDTRLLVTIDRERHVCRVLDVSRADGSERALAGI